MCQLTCILLTVYNSWTVIVTSPVRQPFSTLLTTQAIFDPFPPGLHLSVATLGSKFSPGEPDTTTHVSRISKWVLLQVQPIKAPIKVNVSVLTVTPCCMYIQTHSPWPSSKPLCSAATGWQPWPSSKVKMRKNVKGKPPHKMVDAVVDNQTQT